MRDCFNVGRTPERLLAGFAPPFDRRLREPRLREMMGDDLRLGLSDRREMITQRFRDAPV